MSTAFAGDGDPGTEDLTDGGTAYCQTFIDTFASELGVATDALAPAAKAAASASVNAAVEAGDITQDQADAMIERINNWDGTGCGWIGFHLGGGHHGEGLGFMSSVLTAAADALGMEPADLREALADASLEEVAADQNVSYDDVTSAALAAAKTDLVASKVFLVSDTRSSAFSRFSFSARASCLRETSSLSIFSSKTFTF